MASLSTDPLKAQKDRHDFLELLYEMSGGNEFKWFNFRELGKQLGMDEQSAFNVSNYLAHEGLVKWQALGGILGITHRGIKAVEVSKLATQPSLSAPQSQPQAKPQPSEVALKPSVWTRLRVNQFAPWLGGAIALWVVEHVLDVIAPVVTNGFITALTAASTATIPLWEYRLVTFLYAIPLVYFAFNVVLYHKLWRKNRQTLLISVALSFLGTFGVAGFIDTFLGR